MNTFQKPINLISHEENLPNLTGQGLKTLWGTAGPQSKLSKNLNP